MRCRKYAICKPANEGKNADTHSLMTFNTYGLTVAKIVRQKCFHLMLYVHHLFVYEYILVSKLSMWCMCVCVYVWIL
jgi:hypothetical protein